MNKKIYFILAVVISLLLTILQSAAVNRKYRNHMTSVYVATCDIAKDTPITEDFFREEKIYTESTIHTYQKNDLLNAIAKEAIVKDAIITINDFSKEQDIRKNRYIALKINGENCNANDIKQYDYVDLYFIPDVEHMKAYQFMWLKKITSENGISYNPEEEVGFFIKNVQIQYIDNANNQAQFISLKVKQPYDEIISFMKTNASYDLVKIKQ